MVEPLNGAGDASRHLSESAINWGSLPDWAIVVVAALALWVAYRQLRLVVAAEDRSAAAAESQTKVARATLMLEIDQIFEGEAVERSRRLVRSVRNMCEAAAKAEKSRSKADLAARSAELFSEQLNNLYTKYKTADHEALGADLTQGPEDKSGTRYHDLMRLAYWVETVGMLTENGLLVEKDVLDLYEGVMTGTFMCFEKHIEFRCEDPLGHPQFLASAIWLLKRARASLDAKSA